MRGTFLPNKHAATNTILHQIKNCRTSLGSPSSGTTRIIHTSYNTHPSRTCCSPGHHLDQDGTPLLCPEWPRVERLPFRQPGLIVAPADKKPKLPPRMHPARYLRPPHPYSISCFFPPGRQSWYTRQGSSPCANQRPAAQSNQRPTNLATPRAKSHAQPMRRNT